MIKCHPLSRLVMATHNAGKAREFAVLLSGLVGEVVAAGALGLSAPEETGTTFVENALLKARYAASASGCAALADDSGLCVAALGGSPGVYSADWEGPQRDSAMAMRRLNDELERANAADRSAYFICVLALVLPDGREQVVEGRCDGRIVWPPRGGNGHGFDPVFMPDGHSRTFGEMNSEEKNSISHRAIAMRKLAEILEKAII